MILDWVIRSVDEALLEDIAHKDKKETPELDALRAQVEGLEAKYEAALDNALEAKKSIRQDMLAKAEKVKDELDNARERLAVLERMSAPDQMEELRQWFNEIRPKLLQIDRLVPVPHTPGQMFPRGYKNDPLYVDPAAFTALLVRLGVSITYTFTENPDRAYHAPRHVVATRKVEGYFVCSHTGTW